jgi:hypothetical protein
MVSRVGLRSDCGMNLSKTQQVELMATIAAGLKAGGSQRQPGDLATDALQILEAIAQKVGL